MLYDEKVTTVSKFFKSGFYKTTPEEVKLAVSQYNPVPHQIALAK